MLYKHFEQMFSATQEKVRCVLFCLKEIKMKNKGIAFYKWCIECTTQILKNKQDKSISHTNGQVQHIVQGVR